MPFQDIQLFSGRELMDFLYIDKFGFQLKVQVMIKVLKILRLFLQNNDFSLKILRLFLSK